MGRKLLTSIMSLVVLTGALVVYFVFFFEYSAGTTIGQVLRLQSEGKMIVTCEGELVVTDADVHSKRAIMHFSISKNALLGSCGDYVNKQVKVYWKHYLSSLPWRGRSSYMVDKIEIINDLQQEGVSDHQE